MPTRILHVSDSLVALPAGGPNAPSVGTPDADEPRPGETGRLGAVVDRALERDVDAVVHTGNLFRRREPTADDRQFVVATLERLRERGVPCFVVAGERESRGEDDPLRGLEAEDVVTKLGPEPRLVGLDVALYGLDHCTSTDGFEAALADLESSGGMTYSVLCLHQEIWPPAPEPSATMAALELTDAAGVFVSEVATGGSGEPDRWTYDQYDYSVTYAGSTNPDVRDAGAPTGSLLVVEDHETARREEVPLAAAAESTATGDVALEADSAAVAGSAGTETESDGTTAESDDTTADTASDADAAPGTTPGADATADTAPETGDPDGTVSEAGVADAAVEGEIEFLRECCTYDGADLADPNLETLVDLYGLASRARSVLDDRRKEIRDRLLEEVSAGEECSGRFATVRSVERTRREVRDPGTVRSELEAAGVDPDAAREFSTTKLRELVEDGRLDADAVFDESVSETVRRADLELPE